MTLVADNITCGYDPRTPVLRGLSAKFEPGSLTAIIGPNGAGKSTLLRTLLGVLTPTAGRVTLDRRSVHEMSAKHRARAIVYVPQRSSLAFSYTARAVVAMGMYADGPRADISAVDAALAQVGLSSCAETPFEKLSAGQQQRVTLARALAQLTLSASASDGDAAPDRARVVLADEPVASMDPRQALSAMAALRGLARERGLTVVVAMHDLASVLREADHALVLGSDGRVVASGPTAEAVTPAVLEQVFGVPFQAVESAGRVVAMLPEPARHGTTD